MARTAFGLTIAALGTLLVPSTALAQTPARAALSASSGPLVTGEGILRERLTAIARRSPAWREDVAALVGTGRKVFVLTPEQVVMADTADGTGAGEFDPMVVAAAAPVPAPDGEVRAVLVVVNLPLLDELHRQRGSLQAELLADLDQILVHEVYGHALPYLLAGDLSGRCADPEPGQVASEACSIRRENTVRAELRMGRRTGYGLDGLSLVRGARGWPAASRLPPALAVVR